MVSFVCDKCQVTLKKAKVQQHQYGCRSTGYACVDCNNSFTVDELKTHNSCISEAEKHQGSMYKGQRVGQQVQATMPIDPKTGKPRKHYLDSSSDEEEEETKKAPVQPPQKKQKQEPAKSPKVAPAPSPSPSTSSSSSSSSSSSKFDMQSSIQTLLSKKGGAISLKKLRKGVIKASGSSDKDEISAQLWKALLDKSSEVKISFGEKDKDDE